MAKSPSRQDYMSGKVSFETFYRAVNATAGVKITDHDFIAKVKAALANGDEHLNSIPLGTWDNKAISAQPALTRALKEHGDFFSLGGGVCCMKQAARDAAKAEYEPATAKLKAINAELLEALERVLYDAVSFTLSSEGEHAVQAARAAIANAKEG